MSESSYFSRSASDWGQGLIHRSVRRLELRAVRKLISERMRGASVLDLGCGPGLYLAEWHLQGASFVLGVDSSKEMLQRFPSSERHHYECADLRDFVPRQRFDVIVGLGVLEFLPDPEVLFEKATKAAHQSSHLLVMYPSRSVFSHAYAWYHAIRGHAIDLHGDRKILMAASTHGWREAAVTRAHPYAKLVLYEQSTNHSSAGRGGAR